MNGIGITEWRDTAVASGYPLESELDPNSLFVDASFVQFDGFQPVCKSIQVQASGITFVFTFDDGDFTYFLDGDSCAEGAVLTLRKTGRYYGRIVCGSGVYSLFANSKGATLTPGIKFLAITVNSIPTQCGLFSLQGATSNVEVLTDPNQSLMLTGNTLTWNTVSKPSRADDITLSPSKLYSVTDAKKFVEIDPHTGKMTVLFTLPKVYTGITTFQDKLLVGNGNVLVDMALSPPAHVMELAYQIKVLSNYNGRMYILTEDNWVLRFAADLSVIDHLYGTGVNVGSALLPGASDLFTSPGPHDPNTNSNVSDFIYTYSGSGPSALAGVFMVNGDYHQPSLTGFASLNGLVYAVAGNTSNTFLYTFDPTSNTGTLIGSPAYDPTIGIPMGLTAGSPINITHTDITPLKAINGVGPVNNNIQVKGSNLIQVQQTATDTLTIGLAVDLGNTVISRAQQYE
jgi:hypothetical protein